MLNRQDDWSPSQVVIPRRVVLTLPHAIGRALLESANANQRPGKREALRLLIDQLKAEGRLPREYVP